MGRRSIFRGKLRKHRVQGIMSPAGMKAFEKKRRELAKLAGVKPAQVSDADNIEGMARGPKDVAKYLGK